MGKKSSGKKVAPDGEASGRFVVRLPKSIHEQLRREADEQGISMNTICVVKLGRPFSESRK